LHAKRPPRKRLSSNDITAQLILARDNLPVIGAGSNGRCNTSDKYTREGVAHLEEHDEPEHSGYKRERDLAWSHESVKAKNVDEHWAKKEQPERDVSVGEHERATDQLSQKDDDIEM